MSLQNVNSYTYSPGFTQGQYHNAVLCISGNVQSLYLNGVLVRSTTTASNILSYYPSIKQILLGCAGNKSNGFTGYLDDFRIYKYAFNPSQVSSLYSNRNRIAHYPFDTSYILYNGTSSIVTTQNNVTISYDALLVGNATISTNSGNYLVGTGALNLTNTAGTKSTSYVNSTCGFSTTATNQLSISLWFKTTGISGRRMRLFDLSPIAGTQGIYVDISGTNMINTLSNTYSIPTTSGLIYYFPFEGTNGSTTISELQQGGTYSGSATITTAKQIVGTGCLDCSSGSYYSTSLNLSAFNGLTSVTISCWIMLNALPTGTMCYVLMGGTNRGLYFNNQGGNSNYIYCAGYSGTGFSSPTPIFAPTSSNINKWNHLVWTITNNTNWVAYLNGVQVFTYTATGFIISNGNAWNSIGLGNAATGGQQVNAYLDDLRVYNRALSQSEINTLYNYTSQVVTESTITTPTSNGLFMYFPFNTNVTDTITSTNTTTGTINTSNKIVETGCLDLTSNSVVISPATFTNTFNSTSTSCTISFWIYIATRSASNSSLMYWFVGKSDNTKGFFPTVNGVSNDIGITIDVGTFATINTIIPNMPLNTWKHSTLVFTNSGNNLTTYVDGVVSNSYSGLPTMLNIGSTYYSKLSFGGRDSNNLRAPCLLDDFRVYNRALSQSEITTLYNYTPGVIPTTLTSYTSDTIPMIINSYTSPLWLDTSVSTNFNYSGANISSWKDSSKSNYSATAAAGSAYSSPLTLAVGNGSYNYSSGMYFTSNFNASSNLQTWISVFSLSSTITSGLAILLSTSQGSANVGITIQINSTGIMINPTSNLGVKMSTSSALVGNTKYLLSFSFNATTPMNSIFRLNGNTSTTTAGTYNVYNMSNQNQVTFGVLNSGGTIYAGNNAVKLYETIGIPSIMASSDIQSVEKYLNTKWNLGYTIN